MKRLAFVLFFFVAIPVYGKGPIRAILFHKHFEQSDSRYGSSHNKHYLHGVVLKHQPIEHTSVTILVEGDEYNKATIGDTLLIKYNRFLDIATLYDIIPGTQHITVEIEDREIFVAQEPQQANAVPKQDVEVKQDSIVKPNSVIKQDSIIKLDSIIQQNIVVKQDTISKQDTVK